MKLKRIILLFAILLCIKESFAEDTKEIKALKGKLAGEKSDTAKISTMLDLAVAYRHTGEYTSSKKTAEDALKLAYSCGKYISQSMRMIGLVYRDLGIKDSALLMLRNALTEAYKIKNKKNLADTKNDLGTTFYRFELVDSGLTYLISAAKLREEIGDVKSEAISFANIGLVYTDLGKIDNALEYLVKALEMFRKTNSKPQEAMVLNNIGNVYKTHKKNYPEALKYYFQALAAMEKLQKKISIAEYNGNIGNTYARMGDYGLAKKYLERSALLMAETGDKKRLAETYDNLGQFYYIFKKWDKGLEWGEKTLAMAEELKDIKRKENITILLSACYEEKGNHKLALKYYKMHDGLGDSLAAMANKDVLNKLSVEYETEKKELQIKNLKNEKAAEEAENARQHTQKLFLATGLAGALLLGILLFFGFIKIRKNNKLIASQKREVEHQKEIVEEKNKDIMDSINYAKRIQHAILKSEEHSSKHLPPHFILFKPKDIVSGDFYWALEKQEHLYLCAADCTGHGVPGAFLTMLGISFLNEINAGEKLLTPARYLINCVSALLKNLGKPEKKWKIRMGWIFHWED